MSRQSTVKTAPPAPGDLLAWYDGHRRDFPWRSPPGGRPDPYHVWLSEIMLQQTTTTAVGPYFRDFIARWPRIDDLAAASLDDILRAWQGLGYYARARNLHACAKIVASRHGGRFPETEDALVRLPGIGPYTAAAIAAIAFGRRATVIDGNVERVMARLFGVSAPLPGAKPRLGRLAATLTPADRPGDYAQAVMDLGATVCTPRNPACGSCPWAVACVARAKGVARELPARTPRAPRPIRRGVAFWTARADGAVLLRRRPESGLLGGMMEVPSTPWREAGWTAAQALTHAPAAARWRRLPGVVRHTFTHFHLELEVLTAKVEADAIADGVWCLPEDLGEHALPSVMKKIVRHVTAARRHARLAPSSRAIGAKLRR